MASNAADAVVTRLNGTTWASSTLATNTNLFRGQVRPVSPGIPDECVFVLATGGPTNAPYLGTGKDYRDKAVQVRVRGAIDDFDGAETLALAVHARLHRHVPTGWVDFLVNEPQPIWIGFDDDRHPEFSLNIRARVSEA